MRAALKANIEKENAGRKAPVDAKAVLANGKVTIKPAQKGNRYDTEALLKDFDQNAANVKIVLHKQYQHPLAASSKTVKQEAVKLKALLNQKLTYQVENKPIL
jgi:Putative peptidoglycan binding domain.